MYEYKILLFFIFTFLVHVPTGNSLKCGVCKSEFHSNCKDPSQVTTFEECNKRGAFVCRTVEHYMKKENTMHVARGCVEERDGSGNDPCSKVRLSFYADPRKCQICNTDYCNTNTHPHRHQPTAAQPGSGGSLSKARANEDFAIPNLGGGSFAVPVRSSFCVVITCLLITLYKKNYI